MGFLNGEHSPQPAPQAIEVAFLDQSNTEGTGATPRVSKKEGVGTNHDVSISGTVFECDSTSEQGSIPADELQRRINALSPQQEVNLGEAIQIMTGRIHESLSRIQRS